MSNKRKNSILENSDELNQDDNIFDYKFYLKLIKDNTIPNFQIYKNIVKTHFFANNDILRLKENYYIKQSEYQNIKLAPDCFSESGELIDLFVSITKSNDVKLNNIPDNYYNYIQIILHTLNIPQCIVYNYNIIEFNNNREIRRSQLSLNDNNYGYFINNDKDTYWVINYVNKIIITKKTNFNLESIKSINDNIFSINMDKFITPKSKKQKMDEFINDEWIAASKTRNYALDDPCLDYFRAFNIKNINDKPTKMKFSFEPSSKYERENKSIYEATSFIDFLLISGNNFEDNIIKKLNKKFKNDIIKICNSYEARNMKFYNKTLDEMKKGTPIIYQGVLYNFKHKIFGSVDLLVRSDYINKLVNINVMNNDDQKIKAPLFNKNYHYRVIDIKHSKLHFNTDEETLRNNNNIKPFKTQIAIYNLALGEMQGYLPDESYILGNGWILNKTINKVNYEKSSKNPFNKLGRISYINKDNKYYDTALNAISWIKELNENSNFNHNPPNDIRIYPNMSNNYDGYYHKLKKDIAKKYNEITDIWNCGVKNREIAFKNNIKSWKDPNCNIKTLGITGKKKSKIINDILKFNQAKNKLINIDKISHNKNNWKNQDLTFYVDFETINSILMNSNKNLSLERDYIFMIGIGWTIPNNNVWNYECLYINNLSEFEEEELIKKFNNKIKILENKYNTKANIIHWSSAEVINYNKINRLYNNKFDNINWFDLLKFFKDNNILVLDCLNFSLKTIAQNMFKHGLIKSNWNETMSSGVDAMFYAWKEFNNSNSICNSDKFKEIIKYNEIDCKTMYEILEYLRNNH